METRGRFVCLTLASAALLAAGGLRAAEPPIRWNDSCSAATVWDENQNKCLPAVDRTGEFLLLSTVGTPAFVPDDLMRVRQRDWGTTRSPSTKAPRPSPEWLGDGAGVTYKSGQFIRGDYNFLATYMAVYPLNIGCLGPNWVYTTASNRTQLGAEIYGAYYGCNPGGTLRVFDWSCSPVSPCPQSPTPTAPNVVLAINLDGVGLVNYKTYMNDGGGHYHYFVRYRNESSGQGTNWVNNVWLYNFAAGTWDLIYQHQYGEEPAYCHTEPGCPTPNSPPGSYSGWWGPILEPHGVRVALKETVFYDSKLRIGSNLYSLTPTYTNWNPPPGDSPWTTFHRVPNYTWGVGTTTGN